MKKIIGLILIVGMFLTSGAYANTAPDAVLFMQDPTGVSALITTISSDPFASKIIKYNEKDNLVTFSNKEYNGLNHNQKRETIEYIMKVIRDSSLSETNKTKFFNFIEEQDSSTAVLARQMKANSNADFIEAFNMARPFMEWVNLILGMLVWVVAIAFLIRTVFDVLLLAEIPILRVKVDKKPKIISKTAYNIWKGEVGSSGDRLFLYFKRTFIAMLAVAGILYILINNKLFDILLFMEDTFMAMFF